MLTNLILHGRLHAAAAVETVVVAAAAAAVVAAVVVGLVVVTFVRPTFAAARPPFRENETFASFCVPGAGRNRQVFSNPKPELNRV